MNSRSWRNDELGQLIELALHETVGDARPSPQAWQNIKRRLAEQESAVKRTRQWPQAAIPSFQVSLTLVLLLILISALPWGIETREYDGPTVKPTTEVASSVSREAIAIDYPSEPSPIVVRARDMAVCRALATAVNRCVFEGTLKQSSDQPVNRQDITPIQKISLVRARD